MFTKHIQNIYYINILNTILLSRKISSLFSDKHFIGDYKFKGSFPFLGKWKLFKELMH